MATSEISAVIIEARAEVERSRRLLEEMRLLRSQLRQSLIAVRDSTATLALNVGTTVAGAPFGDMATRFPVAALSPEAGSLDSRPLPVALLEASRELGTAEAKDNVRRPLDPKEKTGLDLLTRREVEVLRLIGEGHRTKEIAFNLGITFKTAVTHRSNIMEKLGIHEGPRLVRFAIRNGIATA